MAIKLDDYVGVRDASLAWLSDNRQNFSLRSAASEKRLRLKAFCELTYALTAMLTHGAAELPAVRALSEMVLDSIDAHDWELGAMLNAGGYVPLLTILSFLRANGSPTGKYQDIAARMAERGIDKQIDVVPYRRLELWRLMRATDLLNRASESDLNAMLQACAPLYAPLPTHTVADAYALTHIVFYATEDGSRKLPPDVRERLVCLMQSHGRIAAADGNLDLVGETLAALSYMGAADALTRSFLGGYVRAHILESGAVPPITKGQGDTDFAFYYHSTLVWAMATVSLRTA